MTSDFENEVITLESIPKYEEVNYTDLHPNYAKIVWLNACITFLLGIAVAVTLFFVLDWSEKYYLIAAAIFLTSLIATLSLLSYKKKKYAFRKHDALYKKGLLYKSVNIIPYIRLQHVVIKQGWYAKRLGLAALELHTAASDSVDVTIPGLTLEEAERWKTFLLNRIQELEDETEA